MGIKKDWIWGAYKRMYSSRPRPPSRFPDWPWKSTTSRGYCKKRQQKTMLLGLWVYYWRNVALIDSILLTASITSKFQVNTIVLRGVVKPSPPEDTMTPSCSRMKIIAPSLLLILNNAISISPEISLVTTRVKVQKVTGVSPLVFRMLEEG